MNILKSSIAIISGVSIFCFSILNELHAQSGYPEIDTSGLAAYYSFNGSFKDSTGNNVDAFPNNALLADDRFCQPLNAVQFTDTDSYLHIDDDPSLDFTDALSISFWLYLDSVPESDTRLLSKSDPEAPATGSYWITLHPGPGPYPNSGTPWSFSFTDEDGVVQTYTSEWGMITEFWVPYTITFDGNMLMLYMDVEPVAIFEVGPVTIQPNEHPLWIGNSVGSGITGEIDDVLIYNRVLQESDIANLVSFHGRLQFDNERPNIGAYIGDTIALISNHTGPFLQYKFSKGEEVIQDGTDSICRVAIQTESDFGEYSCLAYNCLSSHTKYFDVEEILIPSDIQIVDQPHEIIAYENTIVSMELSLSGNTDLASYQWYLNGILTAETREHILTIANLSAADTGYYYCKIMDRGSELFSDSIHVKLLSSESYPPIDTTGLRAYYAFNGNLSDSTGNTGPAIPFSTVADTSIFAVPNQAIRFSGSDSYLEIPDDPDLDINDQLTIALSVRIDTIPEKTKPILSKPYSVTDFIGNYALLIDRNLHLMFVVTAANGTQYVHSSTTPLQPGKWYLLAATYNGSELNTYVNGIPDTPLAAPGLTLQTDDNPLIIGNQGSTIKSFVVDEFRLYQQAMEPDEISSFYAQHLPQVLSSHDTTSACFGDSVVFEPDASGPFLHYTFLKEDVILQENGRSSYTIEVTSEEDLGQYKCIISNGFAIDTVTIDVEYGTLYDNIYIYDAPTTEVYASEGDEVQIAFYVNSNQDGLVYEMYHNGTLIPDTNRGVHNIAHATAADTGAYHLVVINGCERIVSDTVYLILQGPIDPSFEVVEWDWTGNISGSGSSYFNRICTGSDGSYCLFGHFNGGLQVENDEAFASDNDDVFIVKYSQNGDYQWCKFLSSPYPIGSGDLAQDSDGNLYVVGSFFDSIHIEGQVLTTDQTTSGYLAKFSPAGNLIWITKLQPSLRMSCDHIEIDAENHIYLGGNFYGTLTIVNEEVTGTWSEWANVMFVARMDTTGSCEWISHSVTDADMMMGFGLVDMVLSSTGEIVACGTYTGMADFGNGVVLNTFIEAPFLVKYNQDGVAQWGTTMSTDFGFGEAFDVSVDEQGRIFMTGMYLSDIAFGDFSIGNDGSKMEEIFLARFDAEGVCTALNSYGSQGDGGDFGICYEPISDTAGYLMGMFGDLLIMGQDSLLAGSYSGQVAISPNIFIARLTDSGEPLVLKSAGLIENRFFGEIEVTENGRLYFAGLDTEVSVKKGITNESSSIAFVGFKEQGIVEITEPLEVVITEQITICLGDSTFFRSNWYKEADTYTDTVKNTVEGDTIYMLELTTEICSSADSDMEAEGYVIYPNPASQVLFVKSPDNIPFELKIFGLSGNLIANLRNHAEYELDVEGYQPGIYLLKMIKQGTISMHRLMVL